MTFNVYNHLYRIFYFSAKNNITQHNKIVQKTSVVSIYLVENRILTCLNFTENKLGNNINYEIGK